MGYNKQNSMLMQTEILAFSPADSTTYYFSLSGTSSGSPAYYKFRVPRNCSIRRVIIEWDNKTTDASTENTLWAIRVNNTTDYNIYNSSFAKANSPQNVVMNVPLTSSDYFNIKLTTPAWVTNPVNVYATITIEIDY